MTATMGRRAFLAASAGAAVAVGLAAPARADSVFGRYGSPSHRLTERTLYVHPGGAGDFTNATPGTVIQVRGGTYYPTAPCSPRPTAHRRHRSRSPRTARRR